MAPSAAYAIGGIAVAAAGAGIGYYIVTLKRAAAAPVLLVNNSGTKVAVGNGDALDFALSNLTPNGQASVVYSATPSPSGAIAPSQYVCASCVSGTASSSGTLSLVDHASAGSAAITFYAAAYDPKTGLYSNWVEVDIAASSSGPSSTCNPPNYRTPNGSCCPLGEVQTPCPSQYAADPNHPGCCASTCPSSCSSDANCSGCGNGWVCEGGQCQQQVPTRFLGSLQLVAPVQFHYTSTACGIPDLACACVKCSGSWTQAPTPDLTLTLVDKFQRPLPNRAVSITTAGQLTLGANVSLVSPVTDSSGNVYLSLQVSGLPGATGDPNNASYSCNACSSRTGGSGGPTPISFGQVTVTDILSGVQAIVLISASLTWNEGVSALGSGCSC